MKIINARVLVENKELKKQEVLIEDGKIIKIADHIDSDCEIVDANHALMLPGLIDVHVHLREPGYTHKETIKTGTQAAAHGGFTTVMAMPNLIPYPDDVETMKAYLAKIESDAIVNVIPYACITQDEKGKEVADMEGLSALGIKAYSDDGVGVASDEVMKQAMIKAKSLDAMIVAHTEDMNYRRPLACMHEGIRNQELGYLGIPSECEYVQMVRDLKLAQEIGVKYHVCHMSAKESVAYLKQYKQAGVNCSGEVTAHHLLLNEMDVNGPNEKMNPPLRGKDDQEALIQGLLDGTIDMIANDHAPHSEEEKNKGIEYAPFGIVALETAFPLLYTRFVYEQKRFSLQQLVYWMSEAAAKRFNYETKGMIKEGYDADFFFYDDSISTKINKENFLSKGKNTPFDGWNTQGEVIATYVGGKLAYKKEN